MMNIKSSSRHFPGNAYHAQRVSGRCRLTLSAGDGPALSSFGREVNIEGNRSAVSVSPGNYIDGNDTIAVFERGLVITDSQTGGSGRRSSLTKALSMQGHCYASTAPVTSSPDMATIYVYTVTTL